MSTDGHDSEVGNLGARQSAAQRLTPGTICDGRFEIERPIAEGGMGTVFRARDRRTGKPVAIKILHDLRAEDRARFSREARLLSELMHPRIVAYIAQGSLDSGEPYLALEWLDGHDLSVHLHRHGALPFATAVNIARGLAEALRALHDRGILHRDLKPGNVFLRGGLPEAVLLLDLGVAQGPGSFRLTKAGTFVGTPEYMAPEQARRGPLGPETDIYGTGCVLFECMVGRPPFVARGLTDLLTKLISEPAPRLSEVVAGAPPALDALVARMLAKSPGERFPNAAALLSALDALDDLPS